MVFIFTFLQTCKSSFAPSIVPLRYTYRLNIHKHPISTLAIMFHVRQSAAFFSFFLFLLFFSCYKVLFCKVVADGGGTGARSWTSGWGVVLVRKDDGEEEEEEKKTFSVERGVESSKFAPLNWDPGPPRIGTRKWNLPSSSGPISRSQSRYKCPTSTAMDKIEISTCFPFSSGRRRTHRWDDRANSHEKETDKFTCSYSSVIVLGSSCLWNHIMYFVWNLHDCFFSALAARYWALVPSK